MVSVSENLVSEKKSRFRKIWYWKKSLGVGFGQNFGIVIQWRPEDEERENHGDPRAAEDDGCAVTQRNPFKHFKIGFILKELSLP